MSTAEATSYTFRVVNADGSVFGKGCFTHEGPPTQGTVTFPSSGGPKLTALWYHDPRVGTLQLKDVRALAFAPERFALELTSADNARDIKAGEAGPAKPAPLSSHRSAEGDAASAGRRLEFPRPSGAGEAPEPLSVVDLVVAIDASKSMVDEAVSLSETFNAAVESSRIHCPSDLRITYLGVEGTFGGTRFDTTVREYLTQHVGVNEEALRSRPFTWVAGGKVREDGARTIEDLATHFDWRPEAQRAVFFLGDEAMEGGGDVNGRDIVAATRAIRAAQRASVRVHTYLGTTRATAWEQEALKSEYARVARETGGQPFLVQASLQGFQRMLEGVICGSKSTGQSEACCCCQASVEGTSPATTPAQQDSTSYTFRVLSADGNLFGKGCFTHEGPPTQAPLSVPNAGGPKLTEFWYRDAIVGTVKLADVQRLAFTPELFALELMQADHGLKGDGASVSAPGAVTLHRGAEGDFASQARTLQFPQRAEPTITVEEGEVTVPSVDLVVAIDASKSMSDEALGLSEMVSGAIKASQSRCPSDLRVTYLGVEGIFAGTRFTTTVRDYLLNQAHANEGELKSRRFTWIAGGKVREDGAATIEDLANHFDWRPEAQRAVFFLGDEGLNAGGEAKARDVAAASRAIETAQAQHVRVHTYLGTTKAREPEALESEYARVAKETGGQAFTAQRSLSGLQSMLESVICGSKPAPRVTTEPYCCCQGALEDFVPPRPPALPVEPPPVAPPPPVTSPQVVIEQGKLRTLDKVFFASNKDNAVNESLPILDQVVEVLRANPDIQKLRIEAHTDNAGGKAYNQDLSARRARWVQQYLVQKGIVAERLESAGFGMTRPIDVNTTPQGRANNRRVEFVIVE
ncbi:hypothetical protein DRW03_19505 [Corallococcus sp. H22C18031201]|nr:hypothetical protein DRW03_19505 [Corallococcus sp. H22C18031201]